MKNLSYLALEPLREGRAGYAHAHEIIKGLNKRNWIIHLFQPYYTTHANSPSLFLRLLASFYVQIKLWLNWRKNTVIYVRAHYLAFPTALLAKLLGIKIYHEINGPYEDVFVTYPQLNRVRVILIWMQKKQYAWATGLIAVTENLRLWAQAQSGNRNITVIPNGANTDLFRPNLPVPHDTPQYPYVIFFGGLAAWHGLNVMQEALSCIEWPRDIHLVVIGDGPGKSELEQLATKDQRLHILGTRPYATIPAYIGASIGGLVPITNPGKRSETGLFPLKLFETLACDVSVIVTDFPGQADLVREHDCGWIIPSDEPIALARAVAEIANNRDQAKIRGKRGGDAIRAGHSWDCRAAATDLFLRSN